MHNASPPLGPVQKCCAPVSQPTPAASPSVPASAAPPSHIDTENKRPSDTWSIRRTPLVVLQAGPTPLAELPARLGSQASDESEDEEALGGARIGHEAEEAQASARTHNTREKQSGVTEATQATREGASTGASMSRSVRFSAAAASAATTAERRRSGASASADASAPVPPKDSDASRATPGDDFDTEMNLVTRALRQHMALSWRVQQRPVRRRALGGRGSVSSDSTTQSEERSQATPIAEAHRSPVPAAPPLPQPMPSPSPSQRQPLKGPVQERQDPPGAVMSPVLAPPIDHSIFSAASIENGSEQHGRPAAGRTSHEVAGLVVGSASGGEGAGSSGSSSDLMSSVSRMIERGSHLPMVSPGRWQRTIADIASASTERSAEHYGIADDLISRARAGLRADASALAPAVSQSFEAAIAEHSSAWPQGQPGRAAPTAAQEWHEALDGSMSSEWARWRDLQQREVQRQRHLVEHRERSDEPSFAAASGVSEDAEDSGGERWAWSRPVQAHRAVHGYAGLAPRVPGTGTAAEIAAASGMASPRPPPRLGGSVKAASNSEVVSLSLSPPSRLGSDGGVPQTQWLRNRDAGYRPAPHAASTPSTTASLSAASPIGAAVLSRRENSPRWEPSVSSATAAQAAGRGTRDAVTAMLATDADGSGSNAGESGSSSSSSRVVHHVREQLASLDDEISSMHAALARASAALEWKTPHVGSGPPALAAVDRELKHADESVIDISSLE